MMISPNKLLRENNGEYEKNTHSTKSIDSLTQVKPEARKLIYVWVVGTFTYLCFVINHKYDIL